MPPKLDARRLLPATTLSSHRAASNLQEAVFSARARPHQFLLPGRAKAVTVTRGAYGGQPASAKGALTVLPNSGRMSGQVADRSVWSKYLTPLDHRNPKLHLLGNFLDYPSGKVRKVEVPWHTVKEMFHHAQFPLYGSRLWTVETSRDIMLADLSLDSGKFQSYLKDLVSDNSVKAALADAQKAGLLGGPHPKASLIDPDHHLFGQVLALLAKDMGAEGTRYTGARTEFPITSNFADHLALFDEPYMVLSNAQVITETAFFRESGKDYILTRDYRSHTSEEVLMEDQGASLPVEGETFRMSDPATGID